MNEVRSADPEELPVLPALERASDDVFAPLGLGPFPPPGDVTELRAARAVLVVGKPPLGFARIEEVDGLAHLEQLSVHPDHTRAGLGSRLLEAACRWAGEAGYPAITLRTFVEVPWNAPTARRGFAVLAPGADPGLRQSGPRGGAGHGRHRPPGSHVPFAHTLPKPSYQQPAERKNGLGWKPSTGHGRVCSATGRFLPVNGSRSALRACGRTA